MEISLIIFYIIVLIFSVIIHEVAHGAIADWLGDPTARLEGRLTLNPIKHIDPFGSVILPALLFWATAGQSVFGWAKPVPYNPYNLKNPKSGGAIIAAAGPLSNVILAVVFALILKIMPSISVSAALADAFAIIIYTNIILAVFNLVPIPPLDGSKLLFALLPNNQTGWRIQQVLEQYGVFILLIFILWGFQLIHPIIQNIFWILTR
jgi:Zn-dependent protease